MNIINKLLILSAVLLSQSRAGDVQSLQLIFPIVMEDGKIYMGLQQKGDNLEPDLINISVDELSREGVKSHVPTAKQIEPVYHLEIIYNDKRLKEVIDCYVALTNSRLTNYVYLEVGNASAFYPSNHRNDAFIPIKKDLFILAYMAQFLVSDFKKILPGSSYHHDEFNRCLREIGPSEQVSGRVTVQPSVVIPMLEAAARRRATNEATNRCVIL